MSFLFHLAEDSEKLIYFLNGKNCCRLVQNDDPCTVAENLKYLESLLLGYRHVGNLFIKIYVKAELSGCVFYFFADVIAMEETSFSPHSDTDIFESRKSLDQLKVLVNHSYPEFAGIFR